MSFAPLGLAPELLRAVAEQGYTQPTPVQAAAIPLVLERRDVLAGAQTGTGKTAAFVLPILQILHGSRPAGQSGTGASANGARPDRRDATRSPIRCLILTPTRELALQVEESVRTYGAQRPIRSTTIYGGVGFEPQARALRAGPEIVVATPGRLLDHVGQRTIDLSKVEILVLDEADRMLDMGFIRDIRKVIALVPPRRQTLLFSATFSDEIRRLADGILDRPEHVQVTPRNTTTELVHQLAIPVDRERKRDLLSYLIRTGRIDQALVFTRTKHGANRLAEQLARDGISAAAIHGNRSQAQRVRALDDFKQGRVAILVATDIAARGIDIDLLPHVVNYELPMVAEDYIHRIGRTGRAGSDGDAISLVCVDEGKLLFEIERLLKRKIETELVPGFEPDRSIRPEPILQRSAGGHQGGRQGGRPSGGFARPNHNARPAGNAARPANAGARPSNPGARPHPQDVGRPQPASHGRSAQPGRGGAPRRPGQSIGGYAPTARPQAQPRRDGPAHGHTALPGERLARNGGHQGR